MACVNTNEKSFKELISKYGASSGTVENAIKIYMDKNNLETYDPNSPDFINHMDSYFQLKSNNFYPSKGEYNRVHALWEKINPKQDIADIETATKEYNTLVGIFGKDNVTIFETSSGRFKVRAAEPIFGDGITSDKELLEEMYDILSKAPRDKNGNLLAPNGKPSNLNERQWVHVRTKAFKDWFGDWETANNLLANLDKVNNSLVDVEQHYKPWREDKTKGNNTLRIYLKDHSKGYFELVKDNEFGMYSVHFKTAREGGKYNAEATISTKEDRKILFKELIKLIPEGAQISTWGELSEDGIKGLNNVGRDFTKIGEREVTKKSDGSKINIPIYQKGESTSKVVDENGEPLVVYHGSKSIFNVFDSSKSESRQYISQQIKPTNFFSSDKTVADFFALTENQSLASQISKSIDIVLDAFAGENVDKDTLDDEIWAEAARRTGKSKEFVKDFWENKVPREYKINDEFGTTRMEDPDINKYKYNVFLNMKSPIILDAKGERADRFIEANKEVLNNNDEVIIINIDETVGKKDTATDYLVRNPSQIKSATDNIGTYSKENNDIRYATTKQIEVTPDEVSIDSYRKDTTNNPNGFNTISNMNDYLNKFDDADKPMIAQMLASNEIKFICQ